MKKIKIFENQDFGGIRTIEDEGKILFCGKDVAMALGYINSSDALSKHCREDGVAFCDLTDSLGRIQKTKFIDEGNLYRMITHSKLPEAEKFERWVFDEVLPSIRKTGMYSIDYKPKSTSLGEVASYIKAVSRQMEKQGNTPEQIAEMIDLVNEQFGIKVPKMTIKKPFEQMTIFCIKNE